MKKCCILLVFCLLFSWCSLFAAAEVLPEDAAQPAAGSALPEVRAKAFVLMDANTGTLLAANNEHELLYPASVTKIMTLLLVCRAIDEGRLGLDQMLVCSDTAAAKGGSQIWLEPGEEMTVRELLKAAAVYSANDACALLGEAIAGSEAAFAEQMNLCAAELGMENTHFENCTGLDDDTDAHLTTAYDVALMSRALLATAHIRDYTTIWMDTLRGGKTQLVNTNRLIRYYPGATGLKTGTTSKAGCCVSASAERDGLELIAVVMGAANSDDRFNGARALLDYGFARYEIFTPEVDFETLPQVKVNHGEAPFVSLTAETCAPVLLDRGDKLKITQQVQAAEEIDAPVLRGDVLGELRFSVDEKTVARYDLTAAEDVARLTFFAALKKIFGSLGGQK